MKTETKLSTKIIVHGIDFQPSRVAEKVFLRWRKLPLKDFNDTPGFQVVFN